MKKETVKETKKNIKKITTKEEPKKDKNKVLITLIPIIAVTVLVLLIVYIIFIYNNPTNKLKRTLERHGYSCTNEKCTKTDDFKYTINLKNAHLVAENDNYTLYLENKLPTLNVIKKSTTCTYYLAGRSFLSKIDKDYTYQPGCENHIDTVNKVITNYENMLNEAKVDVNDF